MTTSVASQVRTLVLASALVAAPLVAVPESPAADAGWRAGWENGFRLDSPDKKFQLKFGGLVQADFTFADPDAELDSALGPIVDGNEFRRLRFFVSGTLYENVEFKAEYDFAGGEVKVVDVYLGLKQTPIGGIRVGHFKEPFNFEELASCRNRTFLARSLPLIFAPSRNVGIMLHDRLPGDRVRWAIGAFREADGFGISRGSGKLNLTGRIAGLPIYQEEGRRLLHLGLACTTKDFGGDTFRFRSSPEVDAAPRLVDTGSFAADSVDLVDLEAALVAGPFWAMGEYVEGRVSNPLLGDPRLGGFYVQAGFYLTGEHRRYDRANGVFDRTRPKSNFGKGGRGAWEIALRYSTLDLTDGGLAGGEVDSFTVALNGYLNPATRVLVNYVRADRDEVGGADFLLLRFQIDF